MKLFAAMLAVAALIIVFVAIVLTYNMRSGFARYLAEAELVRFDRLHDRLVDTHQDSIPGWPQFKDNRRAWRSFLRTAIPRPGPPRRPRPVADGAGPAANGNAARNRRPPPRPDPMGFGSRLTLFDSQGEWVVGGNRNRPIFARRPIIDPSAGSSAEPLGWIGFTVDPRQVSGSDALFLRDQLIALMATLLLALAISAIAAYFLARQLLKPVRQLAAAGDRLSSGDYELRLDDSRSDELGALLKQFNQLAENLEKRDKIERKWISDTSHELKTPLAVLQAQIEALQDGVHKVTETRLAELHASTMRLSQLVADLNSLSNMREGHLATDTREENISEIIATRLEATLDYLTGKELAVESQLESELVIECDHLRIGQLLDNLLQNAARYTSAPGRILVSATSRDKAVEILIEDTPPCPPEEAREKMFDRFYREELSRDRRFGGSGLGLSICREIVAAHGGSIALSPSELGGLRVTITLPKRQSDNG
ncbi:MAG: ATP-binding protein [Rhizobiaceae bacterium]